MNRLPSGVEMFGMLFALIGLLVVGSWAASAGYWFLQQLIPAATQSQITNHAPWFVGGLCLGILAKQIHIMKQSE